MKLGVVVNPVSGGSGGRLWPAVRACLAKTDADISIRETLASGDAARFARQLADAGCDLVIAVGGDGTIGEAADGILTSSRPQTPLSFIPAGTGSDFARNFLFPPTPEALVAGLLAASARPVDVGILACTGDDGALTQRHFVNIASLGLSGPTVRAVNRARRGRRAPGPLRFLAHSVFELLRYRPDRVRILADGSEIFSGAVTLVAVANGGWFGGGMHVAPQADLADGHFEVVIVRAAPRLKLLLLMNSIYRGAHVRNPLVSVHRARVVEVSPAEDARRPALMDCDGEAPGCIPARFEIRPGALTLKIGGSDLARPLGQGGDDGGQVDHA